MLVGGIYGWRSERIRLIDNNLKAAVLLGLKGGVFVIAGYALGGRSGAAIAPEFAVLFNFGVPPTPSPRQRRALPAPSLTQGTQAMTTIWSPASSVT